MTKRVGLASIFLAVAGAVSVQAAELPKTIAYYGTPSAYFDDHAGDVAQLYDGFFFGIGSWDEGVVANLGLSPESPPATDWKEKVGRNLAHLGPAGVTENLLGVSFGDSAPWPSPETLLSAEYTAKMAKHFCSLGRNARELGFRGVSIDVEYPYPRYSLDHAVYTYDGYTAEDLLAAAGDQGRAVMGALLDAFPDAVIFELPGYLWGRPIERAFTIGMLDVMAERDATAASSAPWASFRLRAKVLAMAPVLRIPHRTASFPMFDSLPETPARLACWHHSMAERRGDSPDDSPLSGPPHDGAVLANEHLIQES